MDRDTSIKLLEAQHTFPSDHLFRVIVGSDPTGIDAVITSAARFLGIDDISARVVHVPSNGGKWVSLRLSLPCPSAATVLDLYAHFQGLPQVVRAL